MPDMTTRRTSLLGLVAGACLTVTAPGTAASSEARQTGPTLTVTAPCAGDRGVVSMQAQRSESGGTVLEARLRRLEHERWSGGLYVDYPDILPNERFRATDHAFTDELDAPERWGKDAFAFYTSRDSRASCVVIAASRPNWVHAGADYIGMLVRPRDHTLRLYFSAITRNTPFRVRLRITQADGTERTIVRTLRSDDSANGDLRITGLDEVEDFTRISYSAKATSGFREFLWTTVERG